jgi:GNAT superfamily N-acetyltransferase
MRIIRTDSDDPDFRYLVSMLDEKLEEINGADHSFYSQFNLLDKIRNVVLVYDHEKVISCGAFKKFDEDTIEIKRMFTEPMYRGRGMAGLVIDELESWAKESGYSKAILETSIKLESAIKLYNKKGFSRINNYGQYKDDLSSICFMKNIRSGK